jgi:hypothetical protein
MSSLGQQSEFTREATKPADRAAFRKASSKNWWSTNSWRGGDHVDGINLIVAKRINEKLQRWLDLVLRHIADADILP